MNRSDYERSRRREDPVYVARRNAASKFYALSREVVDFARGLLPHPIPRRSARFFALVGATPETFVRSIRRRFLSGMTWDNYGKVWTFDHRIPQARFDLRREDHVKRCWHYRNIRPRFVTENNRTGISNVRVAPYTMLG